MEKWVLDGTQSDEEKPVHQQEETVALPASEGEEGGRGCGVWGVGGGGREGGVWRSWGKGSRVNGIRQHARAKSEVQPPLKKL